MKKLLAVLALSLLFPMLFACQPQQSGTPNGDGDGSDGNGQDASDGLQLEHIEKSYIQIEFMESYYMGNLKK